MTLAEADAAFLQYTRVAVLPKGYEDQSSAPVGTGPFVFVKICSWTDGCSGEK